MSRYVKLINSLKMRCTDYLFKKHKGVLIKCVVGICSDEKSISNTISTFYTANGQKLNIFIEYFFDINK